MQKEVTIVGAGPSGLFAAYLLIKSGYRVHLFDQESGVGKKFLVAGNGGLNLTHSENLDTFISKYGKDELFFKKALERFSPSDLRDFCKKIGVETFIGSSGRVFPKALNAAQMLRSWVGALNRDENFSLYLNHKLINIM